MRRAAMFVLGMVIGTMMTWPIAAAHTTAKLILSHTAAPAGTTVWAGVQLKMDPGWHIYWRNPGDSGKPTQINWQLPAGVTTGETLWPAPERFESGGLVTYGYNDEVMLLVPMTVASNAVGGASLSIRADVQWLECEKACVSGSNVVNAALTVGTESRNAADAAKIEAARAKRPAKKPSDFAHAWWDGPETQGKRPLIVEWERQQTAESLTGDFFAFGADEFIVDPATEQLRSESGRVRVRAQVNKLIGDWPKAVAGLLIERKEAVPSAALEIELAVTDPPAGSASTAGGRAPDNAGNTSSVRPGESATTAQAGGFAVLIRNIAFGFIGGLILNLMPCVLPVIALKILGFVNQSHGSPAEVRRLGLIYGAGVLVSFLVLAGLVIAVEAAGKKASWGMQFQNPYFVVAITTLVALVALNLFGVFEVTLGGGAMGKAGELASREGAAGAFFNGVLAVVLATPCTAPFLGAAVGFAFVQPPHVIVLMFAAVAVGLAFPYVLLSFNPRLVKLVPKPGPWMERFKNAMGFPMVATALWLLTITEVHYGKKGIFWIGMFLVMVSIAAWIWGQFVQRGSTRRGVAAAIAILFVVTGYAVALENRLHWRSPGGGIKWLPWSSQAVEEARKEHRPVLVDFTAEWCATCQANKATSIEIPSVEKRLAEINAVPLLGDYSKEDATILKELQKFGRAGVPLVLVYPSDPAKPPIVLPEFLTPSIVLNALSNALDKPAP